MGARVLRESPGWGAAFRVGQTWRWLTCDTDLLVPACGPDAWTCLGVPVQTSGSSSPALPDFPPPAGPEQPVFRGVPLGPCGGCVCVCVCYRDMCVKTHTPGRPFSRALNDTRLPPARPGPPAQSHRSVPCPKPGPRPALGLPLPLKIDLPRRPRLRPQRPLLRGRPFHSVPPPKTVARVSQSSKQGCSGRVREASAEVLCVAPDLGR